MGKIEKHTEYYCDICGDKILPYYSLPFSKNRFYKIKCYDHEGNREKFFDYSYVCSGCMFNLTSKIEKEKKKNKERSSDD